MHDDVNERPRQFFKTIKKALIKSNIGLGHKRAVSFSFDNEKQFLDRKLDA